MELHVPSLKEKGAYFTAAEISRQPQSWYDTLQQMIHNKGEALLFLEKALQHEDLQIVLTGAGSSAFIGEVLQYAYRRNLKKDARALSTTDLVTHFEDLISCGNPLLLISFARSGNSPESIATIQAAESLCQNKLYHLIITCNAEGELATGITGDDVFTFLLPEETEDQSLAMTNSFSSMLIAGFLFSDLEHLDRYAQEMIVLQRYAKVLLEDYFEIIKKIAGGNFERAIFLGSGPLAGIARESHLKLQELTDGHIICKYDSFLGFRHGPKAVLDDKTLIVYLVSNSSYVRKYEADLIREIHHNNFGETAVVLTEHPLEGVTDDLIISLSDGGPAINPIFVGAAYVILSQLLGFYSSLFLGLEPDNPSRRGAISRVVQGVTIYPYEK